MSVRIFWGTLWVNPGVWTARLMISDLHLILDHLCGAAVAGAAAPRGTS